mgnify:FL=1
MDTFQNPIGIGIEEATRNQINEMQDSSLHLIFYKPLSGNSEYMKIDKHHHFVVKLNLRQLDSCNWHIVLTDSMIPRDFLENQER